MKTNFAVRVSTFFVMVFLCACGATKVFAQGDGIYPVGGVLQASDGLLYGMTDYGGKFDAGAVFRIAMDGSDYQVIRSLGYNSSEPYEPLSAAAFLQATDGRLYSTSFGGGTYSDGTVFGLDLDGSDLGVVHSFNKINQGGVAPQAPVIEGSDGYLYGTCYDGGVIGGDIYKVSLDGTFYQTLHTFQDNSTDGGFPFGPGLVENPSDGFLYGTAFTGGLNNGGTFYKIAKNGSGYQTILNFGASPTDSTIPQSIYLSADGFFYGTAEGGSRDRGTFFKLSADGKTYKILHNFGLSADDGLSPTGGLVQASDGFIYGVTSRGGQFGVGTIYKIATDGTGYKTITTFGANSTEPSYPIGGLTQASDGYLYGTSEHGGKFGESGGGLGYGALFRVATDGTGFEVLHSFGN